MVYVKALLSKNEQIVIHTRKHPIALFWPLIYGLMFFVVIIIVGIMLSASTDARYQGMTSSAFLLGVFPICFFFFSYLKWYNEEYFVTNRRVIQSEGIINKRVIDSSLEKVNDVVLSQSWIGRMLNYGDVEILTASEIGVNNLQMIKDPVIFKTEMLNQKEALGVDEPYRNSRSDAKGGHIPDLISQLEKLWKEGVLTDEEFQNKKAQLLGKM